MGRMFRPFSRSYTDYEDDNEMPPNNPNPKRFEITKHLRRNGFTIVMVNYPDATNYNGDKILVFTQPIDEIKKWEMLDPHFFPNDKSPVARFEPTDRGWEWAVRFAQGEPPWSYAPKNAPIWSIADEIDDIIDGTPGTWADKIRNFIGEPYKSREFCKATECPVQEEIDKGKEDFKWICHHECVRSAWAFHDWLQKNGYKIIKRK